MLFEESFLLQRGPSSRTSRQDYHLRDGPGVPVTFGSVRCETIKSWCPLLWVSGLVSSGR